MHVHRLFPPSTFTILDPLLLVDPDLGITRRSKVTCSRDRSILLSLCEILHRIGFRHGIYNNALLRCLASYAAFDIIFFNENVCKCKRLEISRYTGTTLILEFFDFTIAKSEMLPLFNLFRAS